MKTAISANKEALRKRTRMQLEQLNPAEIQSWSRSITERIKSLKEYQQAEKLMFFFSFDGEVDTAELIQDALDQGKRVALPWIFPNEHRMIARWITDPESDMGPGRWNIPQPREDCPEVAVEELDMVIVPGFLFDRRRNRMGRGGGFYDRFLEKIVRTSHLCAVAFSLQISGRVPTEEFDVSMHRIVTEKEII